MVYIAGMDVEAAEGRLWTIYDARGSVTAMILHNAEIGAERLIQRERNEEEKKRQELEKKKKVEEAYEQRLVQVFGYRPTGDAIERAKRVAMAECGNTETIEGIERVFEVVANRVRSDRFPNTIDGVIFQRCQFETVTTGRIWQYEINDKVEQAWDNLIDRGYCNDNKVLFFTAGGYNPYCVPAYKLGNHYFGY
jgi:N-acetylmuramoyl-L-alanine amidase